MDRAKSTAKIRSGVANSGTLAVPILRHSQQAIARLSKRRSTSIRHLQQTVIADPSVALTLFAEANGLLHRKGRSPVTDIQRAIAFVGVQDFFAHIAKATVLEDAHQNAEYESKVRVLSRAHHAAHQASAIARLVGGINCDQVLATTLTHETLEYLTSPSSIRSLLPNSLDNVNVSPIFRTCVELGARWARASDVSWDENILRSIVDELSELCRHEPHKLLRRMREITFETARASDHFGGFAPILNFMSSGFTSRNARNPVASKSPKPRLKISAIENNQTSAAEPSLDPKKKSPTARTVRTSTPTLESLFETFSASARGKLDVTAMLNGLLGISRAQLQMRLSVLLIYDRAKGTLRSGLHNGLKLSENIKKVTIDPATNVLLQGLLEAPNLVHWQPSRRDDELSGLILKLVGDEPAVLYSLHRGGRPFAIVLSCRPERDTRLSKAKIESSRKLQRAAMTVLNSGSRKVGRSAA